MPNTAGILIKQSCSRMLRTGRNRDEHTKGTLMKRGERLKSHFKSKHVLRRNYFRLVHLQLFFIINIIASPKVAHFSPVILIPHNLHEPLIITRFL